MACALGCLVGVWTGPGAGGQEELSPTPFWPASVEWPADLSPFAQAWKALATVRPRGASGAEGARAAGRPHQGGAGSEGVTARDGGWAWVVLGPSGPAVFEAVGVSCLEAGGGEGVAAGVEALPLWALPPGEQGAAATPGVEGAARAVRVEEALGRLAAALEQADPSQVREAAAAMARLAGPAPGQAPAAWLVLERTAAGPVPAGAPGPRRAGVPGPLLCRLPRRRPR